MRDIGMATAIKIIALGILSVALSGCLVIFPKTEDLRTVHKTYREEFHSAVDFRHVVSADETAGLDETVRGSFEKTLAAIADYRRKYPDAQKQKAHLDVLQGMIYLQTGQFGLATLMTDKVAAAGTVLTGDGIVPRDVLFANSFEVLLAGWKYPLEHTIARRRVATLEKRKSDCAKNPGKIACGTKIDAQIAQAKRNFIERHWEKALPVLTQAGESIEDKLCHERTSGTLKLAEGDQGASYLAASGGIFIEWRDNLCPKLDVSLLPPGSNGRKIYDENCVGKDPAQARDLIGAFLPELQRELLNTQYLANPGSVTVPTDRGRRGELGYLDLYFQMNRRAANRMKIPETQMLRQTTRPEVCAAS